jgi:hypothetical protein
MIPASALATAVRSRAALADGLWPAGVRAPGHILNISAPFDADPAAAAAALHAAFTGLERRPHTVMEGQWQGDAWVAHFGHFWGLWTGPLAGLPPSGRPAWLRYGAFERLGPGGITETLLILDLPALMVAHGRWPFAPPLGQSGLDPAPASGDGLWRAAAEPAQTAASLALVEAMIAGLMSYDGKSLASMGMRRFWTPDFSWYGPGPIGMARGHADYERAHQGPFLAAIPDRRGGNHRCRMGDGPYVASVGWPSIRATHTGGDWLGLSATGKPITMRVMDLWRCENGWLAENWVFIDIIELFSQLGIDVLARAAAMGR